MSSFGIFHCILHHPVTMVISVFGIMKGNTPFPSAGLVVSVGSYGVTTSCVHSLNGGANPN